MNTQDNVQIVRDFFAAVGRGDKDGLLALCDTNIEWIVPGRDWPLAGTHRGHAGIEALLKKESESMETSSPGSSDYVAQGDRVLVLGASTGKVKATGKAFEDEWVFAFTLRNGKVTAIREYVDTQELARAAML